MYHHASLDLGSRTRRFIREVRRFSVDSAATPPPDEIPLRPRSPAAVEAGLRPLPRLATDPRVSLSYQTRDQVMHASMDLRRHSQGQRVRETQLAGVPTADVEDEDSPEFHKTPLSDLFARIRTSPEGLSHSEAGKRLAELGPNLILTKRRSLVLQILGYLLAGFNMILWPACVLCILCYQPLVPVNLLLAGMLFAVIVFNITFTVMQDWTSARVMAGITSMMPQMARVIRDGSARDVPVASVTIGDIVQLDLGSKVPADLRLISVSQLSLDCAMITGESEPVHCALEAGSEEYLHSKNMAFMGTLCVEGSATGVVVAKGNDTLLGKISDMVNKNSTKKQAPLIRDIRNYVGFVVVVSIAINVALALCWALWLRRDHHGFMNLPTMLTLLVSTIIAFVPEGLPACTTLTLVLTARAMAKRRVLVKSLPTVHTLGTVNVIGSDKTGTITLNKMTVSDVYLGGRMLQAASDDVKQMMSNGDISMLHLMLGGVLCNQARYAGCGNAADNALLDYARLLGIDPNAMAASAPQLHEIPFNSKNKWALTVHRNPADANEPVVLMKGAPEMLLGRSVTVLGSDGQEIPVTQDMITEIKAQQDGLSGQGKRVLAICKRHLDRAQYPVDTFDWKRGEIPTDGLCFIGLVSLMDPPRPEVKEVVETCRRAHVRVVIITGDYHLTAVAIARMVGIVRSERVIVVGKDRVDTSEATSGHAVVIPGTEIPSLSTESWDWILKHDELVFARMQPEHKLQVVKEFQRVGQVVAVTGDGVNDSPALKQADVGISMGDGNDVAREAAALVLLDNDFRNISYAIERGRVLMDNIKKVVLYLIPAGSWSELLPPIANLLLGLPLSLSPFLMIYICCITDVGPSMAMTQEKSEKDVMTRKPAKPTDHLLSAKLLCHCYFFIGTLESMSAWIAFFLFFWWEEGIYPRELFLSWDTWNASFNNMGQDHYDYLTNTSMSVFFVTLTACQVGNMLATRTRRVSLFQHMPHKKASRNLWLMAGVGFQILATVLIVELPRLNSKVQAVIQTNHVPAKYWGLAFAFSIAIWGADELRKLIARRFPPIRKFMW
eukprot:m51a1_g9062 hypothetical protein (1065) ;mRNA; r:78972-82519